MNSLTHYLQNETDKLFTLIGEGESLELNAEAAIEYMTTLPASMQATFIGELLLETIDGFGYSPIQPVAVLAIKRLEEMESAGTLLGDV